MKRTFLRFFVVLNLALSAGVPLNAQVSNLDELETKITHSLKLLRDHADVSQIRGSIAEVHSAYRNINWSVSDGSPQIAKFMLQHWRMEVADYLLQRSTRSSGPLFFGLVEALSQLNIHLDEGQLGKLLSHRSVSGLAKNSKAAQVLARLLVNHGHDTELGRFVSGVNAEVLKREMGAIEKLDIRPVKHSRFPLEDWTTRKEFTLSNYRFDPKTETLSFRGLSLKPGDVFLTNISGNGQGTTAGFSTPVGHLSHAAFFAIVERNGERFPAVFEIHAHGVRGVPLNVFMSPTFSSYIEIWRVRQPPSGWSSRVNSAALKMEAEIKGFDYGSKPAGSHLSCAAVLHDLLVRTGMNGLTPRSRLSPETERLLSAIGNPIGLHLTPSDVAADHRLQLVGIRDNGQFVEELTRTVVLGFVREAIESGKLSLKSLPMKKRLEKWIMDRFLHGSWGVGPAVRKAKGFTLEQTPLASAEMLLLSQEIKAVLMAGVEEAIPLIEQELRKTSKEPFRIDSFHEERVSSSVGSRVRSKSVEWAQRKPRRALVSCRQSFSP